MNTKIIKIIALIALLTAGGFACTNDDSPEEKLVSIKIQNASGDVDPYIVSFALPGIVDVRCYKGLPYHPSNGGFPEELNPKDWSIHLNLAKGTNRRKLAPVITLAPGCTIMPASGTVLDFSKHFEWTLQAPDGSTVKYYLTSVFVTGDTDEANMISVKIQCQGTGAVDPNIVSFALPGIVTAGGYEILPYPNYGGDPNAWSTHYWIRGLSMAKGSGCTKLAPIITLTPGAKITWIHHGNGENTVSNKVDYSGTFKINAYDFTKQVTFDLTTPDGSSVYYYFLAHDFPDYRPTYSCLLNLIECTY